MWPAIIAGMRVYGPYAVFPISVVVGFIGYNAETLFGNRSQPYRESSIAEDRDIRLLTGLADKDVTDVDLLKANRFVPNSVFEKNQSKK